VRCTRENTVEKDSWLFNGGKRDKGVDISELDVDAACDAGKVGRASLTAFAMTMHWEATPTLTLPRSWKKRMALV
jgi:hypothetical protein